jgi:hypothetical protein
MPLISRCSPVLSLLVVSHLPSCRMGWPSTPHPCWVSAHIAKEMLMSKTRHVAAVHMKTPNLHPWNLLDFCANSDARKVVSSGWSAMRRQKLIIE